MAFDKTYFDNLLTRIFADEAMRTRLPRQLLLANEAIATELASSVQLYEDSLFPSRATWGHTASGKLKFYRTVVTDPLSIATESRVQYIADNLYFTTSGSGDFAAGEYESSEVSWVSELETAQANLYVGAIVYVEDRIDYVYGVVTEVNNDGKDSTLELLGNIKGLYRQPNETEKAFRRRFRDQNDKITRAAIEAIVHKYFPSGYIKEGWELHAPVIASDRIVANNTPGYFFVGRSPAIS